MAISSRIKMNPAASRGPILNRDKKGAFPPEPELALSSFNRRILYLTRFAAVFQNS